MHVGGICHQGRRTGYHAGSKLHEEHDRVNQQHDHQDGALVGLPCKLLKLGSLG